MYGYVPDVNIRTSMNPGGANHKPRMSPAIFTTPPSKIPLLRFQSPCTRSPPPAGAHLILLTLLSALFGFVSLHSIPPCARVQQSRYPYLPPPWANPPRTSATRTTDLQRSRDGGREAHSSSCSSTKVNNNLQEKGRGNLLGRYSGLHQRSRGGEMTK